MATSRIIPTCKCSSHTGLYSFTRLILRTFPTLMSVCILFPLSEMPFFPSVLKKLGQGFGRLALSSLFSVLLKHSLHWYIVSVLVVVVVLGYRVFCWLWIPWVSCLKSSLHFPYLTPWCWCSWHPRAILGVHSLPCVGNTKPMQAL